MYTYIHWQYNFASFSLKIYYNVNNNCDKCRRLPIVSAACKTVSSFLISTYFSFINSVQFLFVFFLLLSFLLAEVFCGHEFFQYLIPYGVCKKLNKNVKKKLWVEILIHLYSTVVLMFVPLSVWLHVCPLLRMYVHAYVLPFVFISFQSCLQWQYLQLMLSYAVYSCDRQKDGWTDNQLYLQFAIERV